MIAPAKSANFRVIFPSTVVIELIYQIRRPLAVLFSTTVHCKSEIETAVDSTRRHHAGAVPSPLIISTEIKTYVEPRNQRRRLLQACAQKTKKLSSPSVDLICEQCYSLLQFWFLRFSLLIVWP
ncbi:hypothetical protein HA466_0021010 [Hirschfeldia incana]|nr:hypothetical protein HA466_0021010 [Hirschfeldia incana]